MGDSLSYLDNLLVYAASLLSVPNAKLFSLSYGKTKMVKSLRLAWISRLLGDTDDSWKVIPNFYFSDYGGLQFLLKCNYNTESINTCLPDFYRELLKYFQEFKNETNMFP